MSHSTSSDRNPTPPDKSSTPPGRDSPAGSFDSPAEGLSQTIASGVTFRDEMSGSPRAAGAQPTVSGGSAATDLATAWRDSARPITPADGVPSGGIQAPSAASNEIDPELVQLSRRPRRRHPLISVVVIVLSLYLMYFVRADLWFFFQSRTPTDLGSVADVVAQGRLHPNTYVTVHGVPDRKHALLLQHPMGGWDSFVRLLQSNNRLYVQQHQRKRSVEREVQGTHTGRIVPFASLPYREPIRAYLRQAIRPEHELDFDAIARAKANPRSILHDRKGRPLPLSDRTEFWINVSYPDEWVVQLAKAIYPSADDAQRQLEKAKLPYAQASDDSNVFWRFVVLARGPQLEQLLRGFDDPGRNAGVVRRQVSYTARWMELHIEGDTLVVNHHRQSDLPGPYQLTARPGLPDLLTEHTMHPLRIPKAALQTISTTSQFELPADAMVLIAGEHPDKYWYYLLLFSLLSLFILFNAIALARRGRGTREHAIDTTL